MELMEVMFLLYYINVLYFIALHNNDTKYKNKNEEKKAPVYPCLSLSQKKLTTALSKTHILIQSQHYTKAIIDLNVHSPALRLLGP